MTIGAVLSQVQVEEEKVIMYGSKVKMMMVYDKKKTFRYNPFCNSEVILQLVKAGVHTPYRAFIVKVGRLVPR